MLHRPIPRRAGRRIPCRGKPAGRAKDDLACSSSSSWSSRSGTSCSAATTGGSRGEQPLQVKLTHGVAGLLPQDGKAHQQTRGLQREQARRGGAAGREVRPPPLLTPVRFGGVGPPLLFSRLFLRRIYGGSAAATPSRMSRRAVKMRSRAAQGSSSLSGGGEQQIGPAGRAARSGAGRRRGCDGPGVGRL